MKNAEKVCQGKSEQKKKSLWLVVLSMVLVVGLCVVCVVCFIHGSNGEKSIADDIRDREIKEAFRKDYLIISDGEALDKSRFIFGATDVTQKQDSIGSILKQYGIETPTAETTKSSDYGVFSAILNRVVITAKEIQEVDDGYIVTYVVAAPDLSHFLVDANAVDENWTSDGFANYLINYIENAATVKNEACVTYIKVDGIVKAGYQTPEFINAVTGGLLDAYGQAFMEMLDSLKEVQ